MRLEFYFIETRVGRQRLDPMPSAIIWSKPRVSYWSPSKVAQQFTQILLFKKADCNLCKNIIYFMYFEAFYLK